MQLTRTPQDLPLWLNELEDLCRNLDLLSGRVDAGEAFESLRAEYEGEGGFRQRAETVMDKVAEYTLPASTQFVSRTRELLTRPLNRNDVNGGLENLRGHLRHIIDVLTQSQER